MELGRDRSFYRIELHNETEHLKTIRVAGRSFITVPPKVLEIMAGRAFHDLAFYLRPETLASWRSIADEDPSANDAFTAACLLRNAAVASAGVLPLCQDTGTAIVYGRKGESVLTGGSDADAISRGTAAAYTDFNLRYSQMLPVDMFSEENSGNNLPAQIEIESCAGNEYTLLFIAKGGGSANKTELFQCSKAMLNPAKLRVFLSEKIRALGTAACPPYRIAVVVGGLSAEHTLKTVKLASTGDLDGLPGPSNSGSPGYRDRVWEAELMSMAGETGLGAQFGGRNLTMGARVIRLPRHAGSCPIGIGVSCSADRSMYGRITPEGVFLEELVRNPAPYLEGLPADLSPGGETQAVDLNLPMESIRKQLSGLKPGTFLRLNGPLVLARDLVHARVQADMDSGAELPGYFTDHPVYYAGPAKTPEGAALGSLGPTTSQRMDPYIPAFMARGASLVSLGKGPRNDKVKEACKRWGGSYLAAVGGAAALYSKEYVVSSEVIAYPGYGMEAVRRIEVRNLPAFMVINDGGDSLY
ncbi:MAG: fumarate hydratase [Spirochaetia bacterium]